MTERIRRRLKGLDEFPDLPRRPERPALLAGLPLFPLVLLLLGVFLTVYLTPSPW